MRAEVGIEIENVLRECCACGRRRIRHGCKEVDAVVAGAEIVARIQDEMRSGKRSRLRM